MSQLDVDAQCCAHACCDFLVGVPCVWPSGQGHPSTPLSTNFLPPADTSSGGTSLATCGASVIIVVPGQPVAVTSKNDIQRLLMFPVPVRRTYRAWPEPDTERCLRPPHWCQPPKLANRFHDRPSVDTSTSTESALAHWHASHSTVSDLSVCSRPRSPVHEPSMPFLVPLLPSIALLAPYAEE